MSEVPHSKKRYGGVRKIIILASSPFNARDEKRFGVKILKENGYEVEVWDLSPFLNAERFKDINRADETNLSQCRVFMNYTDSILAIRQLPRDHCLVISCLNHSYESYPIIRALTKCKLPYCKIIYNFPCTEASRARPFLDKIKKISFMKLKAHFFNIFLANNFFIQPASIVLALAGKLDYVSPPIDRNTEFIWRITTIMTYTLTKSVSLSSLIKIPEFFWIIICRFIRTATLINQFHLRSIIGFCADFLIMLKRITARKSLSRRIRALIMASILIFLGEGRFLRGVPPNW